MRKLLCGCAFGVMLFASTSIVGATSAGEASLGELHGQNYYYLMTGTVNVNLKAKMDEAHRLIVTGQDNPYAVAILDEVIKLDSTISEAFLLRAMAKTNVENYKEADKDYEAALMLEPENPCFYYLRGVNYSYEAEDALKAAIKGKDVFGHVGVALEKAERMYTKALEIEPNYLDAQVGLADAYAMEGDEHAVTNSMEKTVMYYYEKALSIYNHVLVLVPQHDVIRLRKGDIEERIAAYKTEQNRKRQEEETKRRINETRRRING